MIKIQALHKSYGKSNILEDISLSFSRGEIYGIVGENGAGKTTLFKCLAGLESYEGAINYNGKKLKDVTGFLFTEPHFLSKITGLEYLRLVCNARNIEVKDFGDKNVFDLPLDRYADTYSTGMKKKLALTAILMQGNEVFILDEPFNGVDIHSNALIVEVILKLKELNKIVILSSHIFSTLNEICDIMHYLKEGKIVKTAEKSEFGEIEKRMKASGIGNKIEKLDLR